MLAAGRFELKCLLELTARVGCDPLLTQASTGNSSVKLDGELWIKASGKWMANAMHDDILIPLNLRDLTDCLRRGLDPAERFPGASVETAVHAALPHRVVLHAHSVSTIAWAVRRDAQTQLQRRLEGLQWQWIPYVASGLPLSREIARAVCAHPDSNLFILGNHGLVVAGEDARQVEDLLIETLRRLDIPVRRPHPADYSALSEICADSRWNLPDDDGIHALGTDAVSRTFLAGGLLYPCQAIFSGDAEDVFHPVSYLSYRESRYRSRPFLIVENYGVVINNSAQLAEVAMISGLANVLQRLDRAAPIRYLTEAEVAAISGQTAYRYRELANMGQLSAGS
jgi:rhamnose utilization protein RhaD (predicted bifunctional aldolase and dehydrogenase)